MKSLNASRPKYSHGRELSFDNGFDCCSVEKASGAEDVCLHHVI